MFSYDLVARHHLLLGDEGLLESCVRHREASAIPAAEATRLLMNRCSGLLFARERLDRPHFAPADADFVRRNIAKAELGFGDALLAANQLYDWSCRVRQRRLERLAKAEGSDWLAGLASAHAKGVDFKLHPVLSSEPRSELREALARVSTAGLKVWLHLEERRLGCRFSSAGAYAESPIRKCPGGAPGWNLLVNFQALGPRPLLQGRPFLHPRESILNALPLLLWEPEALASPALLRRLQTGLATRASNFAGLVAAYRAIWSRVS